MKKHKALWAILAAAATLGICSLSASAEGSETSADTPAVTEIMTAQVSETAVTTLTTVSTDPVFTTALVSVTNTDAPTASGWYEENGQKYYLDYKGEKFTGYHILSDKEYYFAANGAVKSGFYTIDNVRMYFSPETYERQFGWIEYCGQWYYMEDNGKATGRRTIDGKDYIFDTLGVCMNGWFEYEDSKYYSDMENGLYTNEAFIGDGVCYFSSKGRFKSGWVDADGFRIFYDYETAKPVYGWINYNDNIYYSSEADGKMSGDNTVDGVKYRFAENGCLETGMQRFSDGTRYYDKDGKVQSGIITVDSNKYYFDSKTYLMQTGLQKIGGKNYFFGKDGSMQTGVQTIDGKKYMFGKDGSMQTGLQKINDKQYFFGKDGAMATGWQEIDGKRYCFDKDGAMLTNTTIDGWNIGKDGVAVKLSEVEKRADRLLGTIGKSAVNIFNYVYSHNTYRFMEETRPLSELNSIGWGYFANYAIDNTYVVCYYFAALQDVLFKQAGYEHRVVYGTQGRGDHYWNQIKINGEWRNFDACMGHCDVSDAELDAKGFVRYEYVYPEYK